MTRRPATVLVQAPQKHAQDKNSSASTSSRSRQCCGGRGWGTVRQGEAASERSFIKPVTAVGKWSSVPMGSSLWRAPPSVVPPAGWRSEGISTPVLQKSRQQPGGGLLTLRQSPQATATWERSGLRPPGEAPQPPTPGKPALTAGSQPVGHHSDETTGDVGGPPTPLLL